jgi:hypothetical protein
MSKIARSEPVTHHSSSNLRISALAEGAAGDFTLTGITLDDEILCVCGVKATLSAGTPNTVAFSAVNVTSEFSITAANTINNTAGTDLSDTILFCLWVDADA